MKAKTSIYFQKKTGKGKSAKVSRELILAGEPIPEGVFSADEIGDLIRRKAIDAGGGVSTETTPGEGDGGYAFTVELVLDFDESRLDGGFLDGDYLLPDFDESQDGWLDLAAGSEIIVTAEQKDLLKAAGLID